MRIRAAVLTLALASALLGGCAQEGDGKGKERKAGPPLTGKQIRTAMLTKQDLGKKYVATRADSGASDVSGMGCLAKADKILDDGPDTLREKAISFKADTQLEVPQIETSVATFASVKAATRSLDLMASTFKKCKRVTFREDGALFRFRITVNELVLASDADQQVTVTGAITVSGPGGGFPMALEISVVRIGRNGTSVSMFDATDSLGRARRELTDAAVERLLAVMDGAKPPRPAAVLNDYPLVARKDLQPSL